MNTRWTCFMSLGMSFILGGCSVITPAPLWELTKAFGMAANAAMPYGATESSNTVHHLHPSFSQLCIEFNPLTPVKDIVPALQIELKKHSVESRVYETGSALDGCQVWLKYTAYTGWDIPPMGGDYRSYVRNASLTLLSHEGKVLSSSLYDLDNAHFGMGKWASTQKKLAPVVTALLTGFDG